MLDINKPVSSIMTDDPLSVRIDTILIDAAQLFEQRNFHHLPVIDHEGLCVGMISMSDIHQLQDEFSKFQLRDSKRKNDRFFNTLIAEDVMSKNLIHVSKDQPIKEAIDLLLQNTFRALVVLDHGKLIGILTPYDILAQLSKLDYNETASHLSLPKE